MGKDKKRILHIVNIPWFSGLGSYARDMGYYMEKSGARVTFAAVSPSRLSSRLEKEFEVIPLPGRGTIQTLRGIFRLLRVINNFDAVISHSGSSFFMGSVMKLFRSKIVLVRTRAEKGAPRKNFFNRLLHIWGDAVVVATEKIRERFLSIGCRPEKILVLSPVVDTARFRFSPPPHGNVISIIGRLDRVKGHGVLIEALPAIKKMAGSVKAVFAGREVKVSFESLKSQARALGVEGDIQYRGELSSEELYDLMKNSAVGIITSLGSEAVSRAALEWLSCGRAVVSSDAGCLGEFLGGTGAAFIYPRGDSSELALKTAEILNDRDLMSRMSEKARKLAEERFSPDAYMENLNKIFNIIK